MPYRFAGELYGFDGPRTVDADAPRLRNHLEAFAADSVQLFGSFRIGSTGLRLRGLAEQRPQMRYIDPGNRDPALKDCVMTFLEGGAACGGLSVYQVGWYRYNGEHATFVLSVVEETGIDASGRRVIYQRWHVGLRRANGVIEDWSVRLGMKGVSPWRSL